MKTNLKHLTITDPDYLLCIMWKDDAGNTYRYKMWEDIGEKLFFDVPLYSGQRIKKNFRFEVWSIDGTLSTQAVDSNFLTSVLQGVDYRNGEDAKLVDDDGQVTLFGANSITSDNFPVISGLNARWRVDITAISDSDVDAVYQWLSKEGNNFSIQRVDSEAILYVSDSDLAHGIAVTANGPKYNTANYYPIIPKHIFILVKIVNGLAGRIYVLSSDYATQMFVNINPIDDATCQLQTEDGKTVVTPVGEWFILEVAYKPDTTSAIHVYPVHAQNIANTANFTTTTTNTGGNHAMLITGNAPTGSVVYVKEILLYSAYINQSGIQSVLNYFHDYYNFNFSLPLTFPSNSSPQPN